MKKIEKRYTFGSAEQWDACILRGLNSINGKAVLDVTKTMSGIAMLPAVDSHENGFVWDRVIIDADLPEGSAVTIYAYASDNRDSRSVQDVVSNLKNLSVHRDAVYELIEKRFGAPVSTSCDFLLNRKGRYLWLLIWLRSGAREASSIDRVIYRMEGDHLVDYLPSLYQDDDITRRFLSVFNSIYTDMDRQIESLPAYLDYENNSEEMLRFMAGWLGIEDGNIPVDTLRKYISGIIEDYETMYTPDGIRRNIKRLTGKDAVIIEYADVDPNAEDCPDPQLYREIFGDDPYKFFVVLDDDTFKTRAQMERFVAAMESLIPAGTSMELIMRKESSGLGEDSILGLNTVLTDSSGKEKDGKVKFSLDQIIRGKSNE